MNKNKLNELVFDANTTSPDMSSWQDFNLNFNENGDVYSACSRFCEMAKILKECVIKKYFQLH